MASKTCFSRLAFFFSMNLVFSTLLTTTCIAEENCPRDAIKIGMCAKLLNNDLLNVISGRPPVTPCCTLIDGLVDLEAALCLCTVIKQSVLFINLNIPIALSLLLNNCGGKVPPGFQCP